MAKGFKKNGKFIPVKSKATLHSRFLGSGDCPTCGGRGKFSKFDNNGFRKITCPDCDGTGKKKK